MTYAPVNEQGVVFLFSKIHNSLGIKIEEIKTGFPDAIGMEKIKGRRGGWEKRDIEFEFASSDFKNHARKNEKCDIVVCWKHDWRDCPGKIIELKSEIEKLQSTGQQAPDILPSKQIRQQEVGGKSGVGSRGGTTYNQASKSGGNG